MVSRETVFQAIFVVTAIVAALLANTLFPNVFAEPGGFAIGLVVFYGIALGGTHFYLYLTEEGDEIPRSARARLLVAIVVAFPLAGAATIVDGERMLGLDASLLLGALAALVLLGYFINEMRLGYAEFESTAKSR